MPTGSWGPTLLQEVSHQKGPTMAADFEDGADLENASFVASLDPMVILLDEPDPNFAVVTP